MAKKKKNRDDDVSSIQSSEGESKKGAENSGEGPVPNSKRPFRKSQVRDWFEVLMYGLGLLMFLKSFVFQNFQIPTSSMENSLLIGDHLMANKFVFGHTQWDWERNIMPFRDVKRGDVLVFKYPDDIRQDYIKRCIGLPGERINIYDDVVYIDGLPLDETYTFYKTPGLSGNRDPDNKNRPMDYDQLKPGLGHGYHVDGEQLANYVKAEKSRGNSGPQKPVNFVRVTTDELVSRTKGTFAYSAAGRTKAEQEFWQSLSKAEPTVVPDGFYFMMGDNRNNSLDSRFWGLVPQAYVEGRAYTVWWSYGEDEGSHQLRGKELLWSYARVPLRFLTHTRWNQSMSLIK